MLLHFNLQLVERVIDSGVLINTGIAVLNAHDWLTVPAGFHLSRLLKCPLVTTIHDVVFNKARHRQFTAEDAYIAGIENWACHISNQIVVLSQSVRDELVSIYHAPEERVKTVPSGVGIQPLEEKDIEGVGQWRDRVLKIEADLLLTLGGLIREGNIDSVGRHESPRG